MTQQPPGQQPPFYPGAAPAAPAKKPWFKKWWVWLIIVVLLFGMGSALGGGGSNQATTGAPSVAGGASAEPTKEAPKAKLTLDDGWTIDRSGLFVEVSGYVSNNTDKAITTYVQITFDALDGQGANLGTCLANTNTVDANGRWKFKATCLSDKKEIAEVRFKELTGF